MALERKDSSSARQQESTGKPQAGFAPEASDADVGSALRSAYEQTIGEDIPREMLDLLGKLA